jgi:flagellar basal-body rod protein FlgB
MSMTTDAVTQGLLRLALDGVALRHQAIAANIANATTPGYAPVKVDFEGELARARERFVAGGDYDSVSAEADLHLVTDGRSDAAASIDDQAAALAQNVVHYQALLKGWSKRMSIVAMAVNEGGRR